MANKIAAVVVTYNRLALLKVSITALRCQTHKLDVIIVVNNSSTDGTEEWLNQQPDIVGIIQENKGSAFGFYTGIKMALENGSEWIWCMDDDGRPDSNALAELMKHENRKPCVMNGLVLDKNDYNTIVFKTGKYTLRTDIKETIVEGEANPYNSTLFHAEVIKKSGLPRIDLIIWGDETEYYNRIKFKFGFPVFTVASALHFHPKQSAAFYKKEWKIQNDWKPYFFVRNKSFVYSSRYKFKPFVIINYMYFLAAFAFTIIYYQKTSKAAKLKMLVIAGFDGVRRDTNKSILDVKSLFCNKQF